MRCRRCGSNNINVNSSTYSVSKRRSFIWNLLMLFFTGGLWLLWMLVRKQKQRIITNKMAVCQDCSYSWKI